MEKRHYVDSPIDSSLEDIRYSRGRHVRDTTQGAIHDKS